MTAKLQKIQKFTDNTTHIIVPRYTQIASRCDWGNNGIGVKNKCMVVQFGQLPRSANYKKKFCFVEVKRQKIT